MENNKGVIYVSGGGNWDKTTIMDTHFLNSLCQKKILLIPVAKITTLAGYKDCYDWLSDKLGKISKKLLNISMELDLNKCKKINQFSAVYITGGNTYKLLSLINESGFSVVLKDYIQNGGMVYGASAGAVIMGKDISTYFEENKKYNYPISTGLSLIGDYSVLCHYEKKDNYKIEEYIKRKNNPVIGVPAGVALLVKGNIISIIGDKPVSIFETNGISRKLMPGDFEYLNL